MLSKPPTSGTCVENNFNWITERGMFPELLTVNYRVCSFLVLHSGTYKRIRISRRHCGQNNDGNVGQEWSWGLRVKRREVDKSLISVFAFDCPVFGEGPGPQGDGSRPRCCCHPLGERAAPK